MKNKPINFTSSIVLLLLYWFQFLSFNIRHPSSIIVDNCFRSNFDASARELLSKQIGNFSIFRAWAHDVDAKSGMRRKTCQMEENSEPQKNCQDTSPKMDCQKERERGKIQFVLPDFVCISTFISHISIPFMLERKRNSNSSSASSQCEKFTIYNVFRYCQRVSQMRRIFESSLTEAKWKIDSNHQSKGSSKRDFNLLQKVSSENRGRKI